MQLSQIGSTTNAKPAAAQEDNADLSKSKKAKHRRAKNSTAKIRVKLPQIESYQKEVVFRAEGPGRVVVRLERLMGSDRVRLTDQKFMTTLLERLVADEHKAWDMRTSSRKEAEKERSRQLAIEGLMEPASDMQDLYQHPVFRVNRVLKRLAQLDQSMTAGQAHHLPPLTPIEPFVDDDNGGIFKNYPGHSTVEHMEELSDLGSRLALYAELQGIPSSELKTSSMKTNEEVIDDKEANDKDSEEKDDEEEDEKDEEEAEINEKVTSSVTTKAETEEEEWAGEGGPPVPAANEHRPKLAPDASLLETQQAYGILPTEDLEADWEPFRSHLVDALFTDDAGDFNEFYEMAEQVLGVYQRENETADDFVSKLPRLLQ